MPWFTTVDLLQWIIDSSISAFFHIKLASNVTQKLFAAAAPVCKVCQTGTYLSTILHSSPHSSHRCATWPTRGNAGGLNRGALPAAQSQFHAVANNFQLHYRFSYLYRRKCIFQAFTAHQVRETRWRLAGTVYRPLGVKMRCDDGKKKCGINCKLQEQVQRKQHSGLQQ